MIIPHGFGCSLVWWVDEHVQGAEEFPDWEPAVAAAEKIRGEMEGDGWLAA